MLRWGEGLWRCGCFEGSMSGLLSWFQSISSPGVGSIRGAWYRQDGYPRRLDFIFRFFGFVGGEGGCVGPGKWLAHGPCHLSLALGGAAYEAPLPDWFLEDGGAYWGQ